MAKLTTKERKSVPKSRLGLPGVKKEGKNKAARGGYPMPNIGHARAAISDSKHAEDVGNITAAERARIVAKAHRLYPEIGSSKTESKGARDKRLDRWAKSKR